MHFTLKHYISDTYLLNKSNFKNKYAKRLPECTLMKKAIANMKKFNIFA